VATPLRELEYSSSANARYSQAWSDLLLYAFYDQQLLFSMRR
jgi:hypothetical protein